MNIAAHGKWVGISASGWAVIFVSAIAVTVSALCCAVFVGAPLARTLFGSPPGFHEDFTSRQAYGEALIVQVVALSLAFLILGLASGKRIGTVSFGRAFSVVNPVSVGIGFVVYKLLYESLRVREYLGEYVGAINFTVVAIVAPFALAFCFRAGTYLIFGSRSTRNDS